jgi:hypothetical protein
VKTKHDPIEAAFKAEQITEAERDRLLAYRAEHKRIRFWRLDDVLYVVRKPLPHETSTYVKQGADEHLDKIFVAHQYAQACTLEPKSLDEQKAVFIDYPMFPGTICAALAEIAGAGLNELGKA